MLRGKVRIAPACYHVLHLIPVMAAHEMNFFHEEGLREPDGYPAYEIISGGLVPFGLEKLGLSQAMKEKSIDIALDIMASTIFFQRARGADIYIIAGWRNQRGGVVVSAPDIKSVQELKGRRIGVIEINGANYRAMKAVLRRAGLNPDRDVEWRGRVFPPGNVDTLRSGKVDCITLEIGRAERLKKEGFNIIANPKELYPNGFPVRIIAATGKILESKPEYVKAFLKGMIRIYWFIRTQPAHLPYLQALEKRLRFQSADPEESTTRFAMGSPEQAEAQPFPLDGLPTGFEALLDEEREAGELNYEVPPIREVCALDLVREAFQELMQKEERRAEYERAKQAADRLGY
ncbi:MAG TPA: ABC transporter substrate-binding protein [Candidatus Acidoferrales bacterium]|nr:ABC transporter substrate-binding protein [Candidatus Acidoferrales bacterium]